MIRLFHADLIRGLPDKQLNFQLKDCLIIATQLKNKGRTSACLVDYINHCSIDCFNAYCNIVLNELERRNGELNTKIIKILSKNTNFKYEKLTLYKNPYPDYHNYVYSTICYYNLLEKYIRCYISPEDWNKFSDVYEEYTNLINDKRKTGRLDK